MFKKNISVKGKRYAVALYLAGKENILFIL